MVIKNYSFFCECLEKIVNGEKFYKVLNTDIRNSNCSEIEKQNAKVVLGSSIRHYLFLSYFLDKKFNIKDGQLKFILVYFLNDLCFTKRYIEDDIISSLEEFISINKLDININEIISFYKSKTFYDLLKDEFNKSYNDLYFSLRFNIPEWIFKLLRKHYGISKAIEVAKNFTKKESTYLYKNPKVEEFKINDQQFEKYNEELYRFNGNTPIQKNVQVSNNNFLITNLIDYELSKKIKINNLDNVLIYADAKSNLAINIFNKSNSQNTINLISSDFNKIPKILEYFRKNKTPNTFYDQCEPEGLEARISRKVNLALCVPESSSFSNVLISPDYLLNFDMNSLTNIIEKEKRALNEVSTQVLIGGQIIYLTYTLNKKENEEIVSNFIKEHPGYYLKEEKVCWPNQDEHFVGYYAIIGREY